MSNFRSPSLSRKLKKKSSQRSGSNCSPGSPLKVNTDSESKKNDIEIVEKYSVESFERPYSASHAARYQKKKRQIASAK